MGLDYCCGAVSRVEGIFVGKCLPTNCPRVSDNALLFLKQLNIMIDHTCCLVTLQGILVSVLNC